ncbi:Nramp family divalent metal transporter [Dasania sp. GY-MA-18]|uniref:Nramp family divalent metal transporter n=1 Tax=Dasania phycosphaerae TaxID=2950436 RepID=A0A9J6RH25_9GAMM|nr:MULTISPECIES: Nramp family divalent metal transporter [Dasania]MCR8921319.1 Nramp family divalent metal transporter [Dasania sp. GY-MA-18]MCZ0863747.1 Nramp family divalent metal transporter [Dasania phycosphaerae]MCZ0867475.1 Nramp family divalent metal transporter [Dasania phycosphaerae]
MKRFGPGLLVMAAFVGPGTVTTASKAGAHYGYTLMWALLFSIIATLVLQEMSSRLGLVSRKNLAQALRSSFNLPFFNIAASIMVVLAIGFGNAAYESGNIAGAAMGLAAISPLPNNVWALVVGLSAFSLLAIGKYALIEKGLMLLVLIMSIVFIATAVMVQPDFSSLWRGLSQPSMPTGSTLTVIALIGTTVVPYNLFLHSSTVQEKWPADMDVACALKESRQDNAYAIGLGGLITIAIVTTAASAFYGSDSQFSASTISQQLEPLLGSYAKYFFAIGLLAAGLTSAIASPLAAAYAVSGAMGWPVELNNKRFKCIWALVLLSGTVAAALGTSPISAIIFAQAANGFLLPVVAVFLLIVMNQKNLLGKYTNSPLANILGAIVVLTVSGLGLFKLATAFNIV